MPPKKPIASSKAPRKVAAKQTTNSKASSPSKTRLATGKTNKPSSNTKTNKRNLSGEKTKGKTKDGKGEVCLCNTHMQDRVNKGEGVGRRGEGGGSNPVLFIYVR